MTQETLFTVASEYWIPEFGLFDAQNIDPERVYQGRVYRLTVENIRAITEALGFTAAFDAPNMRDAYIDLMRRDSRITLTMDRNTKPTDLNLRFMRDRWETVEIPFKERDPMRPWVKACFLARFLPEKVYAVLSSQIRLEQEDFPNFYIRINFRDRIVGLIAESEFVEKFPTGPFEVFAIPENQVPVIPTVIVSESLPAPAQTQTTMPDNREISIAQQNEIAATQFESRLQNLATTSDSGPKYATYSKSEIDRMFKQQSESIASALGSKISGQQRVFQDSVEKQDKTFNRLLERLALSVDDAANKLNAQNESYKESQAVELQQFKKELSQELDQFRAHVNKSILPVGRQLEEKIQAIQVAAKSHKPKKEKSMLPALMLLILVFTAAGVGYTCLSLSGYKLPMKQLENH